MPAGQTLAYSELWYFSCTCLRKASTSGVRDLQALLLEEVDDLAFFLDAVFVVEGGCSLGSGSCHLLFLRRAQGVEALVGDGNEDAVHQVAGEHDLFGHLIELGGTHRGQRVVLAVDGAGLQAQVHLAKGQRRGGGTQRLAQEQPFFGARHAQLHAFKVRRRLDRF
jgi:hypothetical protein